MKKSQIEWVERHLRRYGKISRNLCLRNYVSRLSAIINVLIARGYKFDYHTSANGRVKFCGNFVEKNGGTDYVYKLVEAPKLK